MVLVTLSQQFLLKLVLSILASVIVMYFSRKREYVADTGGADLAGHQNMINALKSVLV